MKDMDREPLVSVDGPGVKLATGEWFNLTDWKSANQLHVLCLRLNDAHEARAKEEVDLAVGRAVEEFRFQSMRSISMALISNEESTESVIGSVLDALHKVRAEPEEPK